MTFNDISCSNQNSFLDLILNGHLYLYQMEIVTNTYIMRLAYVTRLILIQLVLPDYGFNTKGVYCRYL